MILVLDYIEKENIIFQLLLKCIIVCVQSIIKNIKKKINKISFCNFGIKILIKLFEKNIKEFL